MKSLFSGFGYELWFVSIEEKYVVLNGDGDIVAEFSDTFSAKKWMKENKTSKCWKADGTWDWSRA